MENQCSCGEPEPSTFHLLVCSDGEIDNSSVCELCVTRYDRYTDHLFEECDGGRHD